MAQNTIHKVVYIHGRPSGHPMHDAYANELNADFLPVDFILPWHENQTSVLKKYVSWILCAFFFPHKKKYSIFFTESVREPLLIMKLLGLISSRQKLVPLMANETLFFYLNNRYSKKVMWLVKKFLEKSDAIICVGEFQTGLAKQVLDDSHHKKIKTVTNWIFRDKSNTLCGISPDLSSNTILFIGDVSADFRAWYKGVDIMIKAFAIAALQNPHIFLQMVGINDEKYLEKYLLDIPQEVRKRISIEGRKPVFPFFKTASLYLHCARGEAWGMTIMEALVSGVPVICSDLTGAKEVVMKVSPDLIVQTNEGKIAEKIVWYFNLSREEKMKLSEKGRNVMEDYTEEKSLDRFKNVYANILKELYA